MTEYNFKSIEQKWQKKWQEKKIFNVKERGKKPKFYVLEMFPYPSGSGLHMGHAFNYTIGDVYARFKRLQGYNVLYPMGYDSFGLPAENAAIKARIHPKKYTDKAIANFIKQQKALGLSYDWNRTLKTSDVDYYRWNQYLFLKLFEKGLVYRKKAPVNYCEKCNTVLANEQVHNGRCWRHENTEVQIKQLEQWFIKTTKYADELLQNIEKLNWPERIKIMQKNWIGKSFGSEILFDINKEKWPIFTTRSDTIFGVTFMVISSQHPLLFELVTEKQKKEVEVFLKKIKSTKQEDIDKLNKEGVFTGSYAINPMTKEKVPIYAGNFVVADYGSGVVMAVPSHDQRDFEFAKKYNLPIKQVIECPKNYNWNEGAYAGLGNLINSAEFNGLDSEEAKGHIIKYLEEKKLGKKTVQYKLKDWLISRQRYWGTPIPMIYCESCKKKVEDKSIVLSFYNQESFENLKNGSKTIETRALNPEEKNKFFGRLKEGDYLKCLNKINGEVIYLEIINVKKYKDLKALYGDPISVGRIYPAKKINSISDLESCYTYTQDYLDRIKKNGLVAWGIRKIVPGIVPVHEKDLPIKLPEKVKFGKGNPLATNEKWVNIKCPKCKGKAKRETDTMDTFFDSSWYYLRYCDNKNKKLSFDKKKVEYWMPIDQYIGGEEHACMHLIYARFFTKALRDLGFLKFDEPFLKLFNQGMLHGEDGFVMSKSRGNVVLPEEISKKYGIDAARLFLLSIASPDKDVEWSETGIEGSFRFIKKVIDYFEKVKTGNSDEKTESKLNKTIKEVTNLIEGFNYNLAIIKIRSLFESFREEINKDSLEIFLKLLHPFCPHITEELWIKRGGKGFISLSSWPKADEKKINDKFEKEEELIEGIIRDVNNIVKIIKDKGNSVSKLYLYTLPDEVNFYADNAKSIEKRTNLKVKTFAVNDKNKHDPEDKSKKAKPGKPGIYLE